MMECSACGERSAGSANFCSECGRPTGTITASAAGQSLALAGTGNRTKINKFAPKSVTKIKHSGDQGLVSPPPAHGEKWSWRSPLTQARLAWLGALLGVASLAEGYQGIQPFLTGLLHRDVAELRPVSALWMFAFVITMTLFLLALTARNVVKDRTQRFSTWSALPVVKEIDGRLGLARYSGKCNCGGRLRFYNKPTAWADHQLSNGRMVQKVTERTMAMECKRNPRHWWSIDPAERVIS